jgi:hypothetical protein
MLALFTGWNAPDTTAGTANPVRCMLSGRGVLCPAVRKWAGKPVEALLLGLLELFVFFAEPFDAAGRVDQLLFAGKKRVALGTNFHGDVFPGRTDFEFGAAMACNFGRLVIRMNVFFHGEPFTSEYFKTKRSSI